jgi:hypothetical protein
MIGEERLKELMATEGWPDIPAMPPMKTGPEADGKGGLSYRGGGYYQTGMAATPKGEISGRTYGAWGEGPGTLLTDFVRFVQKNSN